jgi:hypothetical protein
VVVFRRVLLSICIGLVLELLMFFSLLPKDSTQPMNTWQKWGGYTQAPGFFVFGILGMSFGHALDRLPPPIGYCGAILLMGIAASVQVGVFTLPIWLLLRSRRD